MGCYCDYEPASIYRARLITARKQHKCCECMSPIDAKSQYEQTFIAWEGTAKTYKTCMNCVNLREWVEAHISCFCWAHGRLLEDAADTVREYRNDCPGIWFGFLRQLPSQNIKRHSTAWHRKHAHEPSR